MTKNKNPKISIITAVLNNEKFINDNIKSVNSQSYKNVEHIIVDGGSTDDTLSKIKLFANKRQKIISEKDSGIYHALNKGIKNSTGSILCILNSDDYFASKNVLSKIVKRFLKTKNKVVFSNVLIISKTRKPRYYYQCTNFSLSHLKYGNMPPHPGLFFQKSLIKNKKVFNIKNKIASDFEFLCEHLFKNKQKYLLTCIISVKMREGGISNKNILSKILLNKETILIVKKYFKQVPKFFLIKKYFIKIKYYLKKPR